MKVIGITIGDPAGVGPELIVRLTPHLDKETAYVVYGEYKILRACASHLGMDWEFPTVEKVEDIKEPGVYVIDLNVCDTDRPSASITSGKVAVAYLARAVVDGVTGKIKGMVTMPINKFWASRAGFSYSGQTEFLAQAFSVKDYAMLMYSEKVKVALLSTHLPLREAVQMVKKDLIKRKLLLVIGEYRRLFKVDPKVGVLGLNPHAGDMGQIGNEDVEEILPAVEELRSEGYKVEGPLSPDAAFLEPSAYDIFFCMYHDQGLIPFKILAFREGVNITLGIPIVRTSPAHGTAYSIAWKGKADISPSLHALHLCRQLVYNMDP
ncbi:4-hydroxythreonine-4-phosphate dehydrogenase [Thermocrinis albus DSM 14484]|uniref:4-hydroxythreonine-4-phosphate dehydrogenase n=1 Tax=Thermocrinis albus (strain DSM 14484 / JCM 11386 / HI 11/12) TaxID=638303 RepID=D3SLG0_THEAH|nr:4-hydroxythreonine-4-phosphate dehydrogenase PdxA [Thermocrinis albus]ADC89590.1 4-hydroxythreonine-4-phosphate dehydrogenase [Thermocrinis albus DSM 14484]